MTKKTNENTPTFEELEARLLKNYMTALMEFEFLMHRRAKGSFTIGYDQKMTDWCLSSENRRGFSRFIMLNTLKGQTATKSDLAKGISVTFQAASQIMNEAEELGYVEQVEDKKNQYVATDHLMKGAEHYVRERHKLISSDLIRCAQAWESFCQLYEENEE